LPHFSARTGWHKRGIEIFSPRHEKNSFSTLKLMNFIKFCEPVLESGKLEK
jgi:hypothetical protein